MEGLTSRKLLIAGKGEVCTTIRVIFFFFADDRIGIFSNAYVNYE